MARNDTPSLGDENKSDASGTTWLTATDVITRTGISKSDLSRFIQLGALPEAMLRFSPTGSDGSRRISAFSAAVLAPVARLQRLRKRGQSVEAIAAAMRQAESTENPTAERRASITPAPPSPEILLHLSGQSISGSALFINPALHIAWVNVAPGDQLFGAIRDEFADNPPGTVFDILLRASLKELVFDWQPFFTFIHRFLQETTPAAVFNRLAPMIQLPFAAGGPSVSDDTRQYPVPPVVDSCPFCIADKNGHIHLMRLYAIAFTEGTLCLYQTAHAHDARVGTPPTTSGFDGPLDRTTLKTAFGVLSARIDNSQHIVATFLPETYFQIMTRIWEASDEIVLARGGRRAKRSGTDVQYVIPQQADIDPAFDAIRCAVKLQKRVAEINRSLKEEGGWVADIRLNIGISSGRDHLPEEDPSASMAFMLPGGAADQAQHLSAIGQAGEILITKSAFGHLSASQMDRIIFGIFRNDRLIPRTFAQVADFAAGPDNPSVCQEIRSLFITRIMDLKTEPEDSSDIVGKD